MRHFPALQCSFTFKFVNLFCLDAFFQNVSCAVFRRYLYNLPNLCHGQCLLCVVFCGSVIPVVCVIFCVGHDDMMPLNWSLSDLYKL